MSNLPSSVPPSLLSPSSSPVSGSSGSNQSPSDQSLDNNITSPTVSLSSSAATSSTSSSSTSSSSILMSPRSAIVAAGGSESMWVCPFDCGQRYKRSSGRSIRRHVNSCFRLHNPAARALSDEQLSSVISEQQASGQLITGLRRWKMRQPRRLAEELSDEDRWDCLWGCGKSYRATSSRSIQRHANSCYMRPEGETGDVDVKGLREQSREQRKKRREESDGRFDSGNSSFDEAEAEAEEEEEDEGDDDGEGGSSSAGANSSAQPSLYPRSRSFNTDISSSSNALAAYHMRDIDQQQGLMDDQRQSVQWDGGGGPGVKVEPAKESGSHQQSQSSRSTLSPYPHQRASQHVSYSSTSQSQSQSHSQSPTPVQLSSQQYHSSTAPHSASPGFDPYSSPWPPPHAAFLSNNSPPPWPPSAASSISLDVNASQPQQQQSQQEYQNQLQLQEQQFQYQQQQHLLAALLADPSVYSMGLPFTNQPAVALSHPSSSSFSSQPTPLTYPSAAFSSSSAPADQSSLSAFASPLLSPADYRSLYEREQQVSDQLRALITSLYSRYGLHHPVFQQRIVSPQLIQQAIRTSAAAGTNVASAASTGTFAAHNSASSPSPSAVQATTLSSAAPAGVDWQEEYSAVLSRFLQSSTQSTQSASPDSSASSPDSNSALSGPPPW